MVSLWSFHLHFWYYEWAICVAYSGNYQYLLPCWAFSLFFVSALYIGKVGPLVLIWWIPSSLLFCSWFVFIFQIVFSFTGFRSCFKIFYVVEFTTLLFCEILSFMSKLKRTFSPLRLWKNSSRILFLVLLWSNLVYMFWSSWNLFFCKVWSVEKVKPLFFLDSYRVVPTLFIEVYLLLWFDGPLLSYWIGQKVCLVFFLKMALAALSCL